MGIDLHSIRNIGIAAHIDAGKTTTTERMLYYTGTTHKMGEVDDGTTITDFDAEEQRRGITIYSAAVSCPWKGYTINVIDTPGHVDFTAEVERSLRVLDGMVAVFDAKEGVEAQSETVWRQADKYHVPRLCFINKMDKAGADFAGSFASIEARLHTRPVALQIPIGEDVQFEGIIDLLDMEAIYFDADSLGSKFTRRPIPENHADQAAHWRSLLLERVCETDEALTERFVHDLSISTTDLKQAVRRATIANRIRPVLCGSALRHVGVQQMLDAICDYLPSPRDLPVVTAHSTDGARREIPIASDPAEAFAGLVFKVVAEKPVDLYFVRIYSGRLTPNSRVLNTATDVKENVTRLLRIYAKRREVVDVAEAGEIVAVIGPKSALTGHTLCSPKRPVLLESIEFPETVVSQSIEPSSSRDRDKLVEALTALGKQDPTFRFRVDEETGQTLISGMGELHLEVFVHRIVDDMKVDVRVGKPRVSYREAVSVRSEAEGRFAREFAGRQHFAAVRLRVEPLRPAEDQTSAFVSLVPAGVIKREHLVAVETGVRDAALSGPILGYPMINWRAVLLEAEEHPTDSSVVAFEAAARMAYNAAATSGQPSIMEPIMAVEIRTPDEYFGAINSDLNARRAIITNTEVRGTGQIGGRGQGHRIISAQVPLAEMFGYTTHLRSLSQGRASASMEPLHYAAVPASLAARLTQ